MKSLNTLPIESFIEKANIAIKSRQKSIVLDIKEVQSLYDNLTIVMTRLSGELDAVITNSPAKTDIITVKMDGGGF